MNEIRYLISDASKKVDVETHVLRYWEDELGVSVPRNEMGHRYYTEFHIHLFCQVKKLKDRGYQLKAIKNALQQVMGNNQGFMQAAGLLEEDMARTLWENPYTEKKEEKETLSGGTAQLAEYSRLEAIKEGQALKEVQEKEEKRVEKLNEKIEKKIEEKVENKLELKEKDGQTEMKKKGKNRKKPSAWERRNGLVRYGQESFMEENDEIFQNINVHKINVQKPDFTKALFQNINEGKEEEIRETHIQESGRQEIGSQGMENQGIDSQGGESQRIRSQGMERQEIGSQGIESRGVRSQGGESQGSESQGIGSQGGESQGSESQGIGSQGGGSQGVHSQGIESQGTCSQRMESQETHNQGSKSQEIRSQGGHHQDNSSQAANILQMRGETSYGQQSAYPEGGEPSNHHLEGVYPQEKDLDKDDAKGCVAKLNEIAKGQEAEVLLISQDEKMQQFQSIMTCIIGRALEANNEKLSQEISRLVNARLSEELEDLMRIRDERDEERFRQLDEIIRSYQRDSQGKAEAAAARIPFFKKNKFKKHRPPQNA